MRLHRAPSTFGVRVARESDQSTVGRIGARVDFPSFELLHLGFINDIPSLIRPTVAAGRSFSVNH